MFERQQQAQADEQRARSALPNARDACAGAQATPQPCDHAREDEAVPESYHRENRAENHELKRDQAALGMHELRQEREQEQRRFRIEQAGKHRAEIYLAIAIAGGDGRRCKRWCGLRSVPHVAPCLDAEPHKVCGTRELENLRREG